MAWLVPNYACQESWPTPPLSMSRTIRVRALILKTYNVGEADRFCILFTKERGKITARARAVRKLSSKTGASMLGSNMAELELHAGKTGYIVTETNLLYSPLLHNQSIINALQPVIECCLLLLPDEQPQEDVFAQIELLWQQTLVRPIESIGCILAILSMLGYVPSIEHASIQERCSAEELMILQQCTTGKWNEVQTITPEFKKRIALWIQNIVKRETGKSLQSLILTQQAS